MSRWLPRLAARLQRWARRAPATPAARARDLGRRGERFAARLLRRQGYRVLARNVRTPRGEIDLLALDGRVLVVVEVKTARAGRGVPPERRLRSRQRRRLRAASGWIARRTRPRPHAVRRDLVAVTWHGRRARATLDRGAF